MHYTCAPRRAVWATRQTFFYTTALFVLEKARGGHRLSIISDGRRSFWDCDELTLFWCTSVYDQLTSALHSFGCPPSGAIVYFNDRKAKAMQAPNSKQVKTSLGAYSTSLSVVCYVETIRAGPCGSCGVDATWTDQFRLRWNLKLVKTLLTYMGWFDKIRPLSRAVGGLLKIRRARLS